MISFLKGVFKNPQPLPEVEAVLRSADRVVKASKAFRKHNTTLEKMVKSMKGPKPSTNKRVKK